MGPKCTSVMVLHAVIKINLKAHCFIIEITNMDELVQGKLSDEFNRNIWSDFCVTDLINKN